MNKVGRCERHKKELELKFADVFKLPIEEDIKSTKRTKRFGQKDKAWVTCNLFYREYTNKFYGDGFTKR